MVDLLENGKAVIASTSEVRGLKLTERGLWGAAIDARDLTDVHAMKLTANWWGMPFQVVRRFQVEGGIAVRLVYIGRDVRLAEAQRLEKMDAGVYEATVRREELSDMQAVQLSPA